VASVTYIPILMFLAIFVLDLWTTPVRRTTWHRDLNLWPCWRWSITAIRVFVLHLYTKFEVGRPFRSEDMTHFRSQLYVGLVTLTFAFDLETGAHYCPRVDNLPTNFGVARTFRSRLIGQLSDASRDLATWGSILEVTALVANAGLRAPYVYQDWTS